MKRKLVSQAGQALTITVPIEWIRSNGLSAGDEVDVQLFERELILSSTNKVPGKKIKLELTNQPEKLSYVKLNAAYAKGVDEIELTGLYPDLKQNIGYAVVSQKQDKYVIRDVSGQTSENLDEILKRVFQMLINFYDSAISDIFGPEKETIEGLNRRDEEINKFVLFLQRAIIKMAHPDPAGGKIMFAYSYMLEIIGDEILRLWRTNIQNKTKKDAKIKELIMLSNQSLQKAFEVYYQENPERMRELMVLRDNIRKKTSSMLKNNFSEIVLHANKIAEDAYDLTHLSLMKKI